MKKRFREFMSRALGITQSHSKLSQFIRQQNNATRLLLGKQLANQIKQHGVYENIHDAEFKVFSQFGDDGILQYLIQQTHPEITLLSNLALRAMAKQTLASCW
jgi:hypothetical protein